MLVLLPIVTVAPLVLFVGAVPKPNWNELVVPTPLEMENVVAVVPDAEVYHVVPLPLERKMPDPSP